MTRIKVAAPGSADDPPDMSAIVGLPLVGVLLVIFVLVRDAARKDKLRRRERGRQAGRFYWQPPERSERSQMRENAAPDTIARTGPHARRQ